MNKIGRLTNFAEGEKAMHPGIIGGVIGGIVGVLGGIIGTYFGIKNTNGPNERQFAIKAAIVSWIILVIFLALLFALPKPYGWFMWIPYGVILPFGIIYMNKTQQRIRTEEAKKSDSADQL
ncbi:hypothetical protein JXA32_13135 [Candidatus Sumerlaeota bacterium]|nr:hypothetical protein [Candidatus Sumerlaeota bacterium]